MIDGSLVGEELKKFNEKASEIWKKAVLVACDHCQRTFFPEKLRKHQILCTSKYPMKNLNKVKGSASRQEALVKYPNPKKEKSLKFTESLSAATDDCKKEEATVLNSLLQAMTENQSVEDRKLSSQLVGLVDYLIENKLINLEQGRLK